MLPFPLLQCPFLPPPSPQLQCCHWCPRAPFALQYRAVASALLTSELLISASAAAPHNATLPCPSSWARGCTHHLGSQELGTWWPGEHGVNSPVARGQMKFCRLLVEVPSSAPLLAHLAFKAFKVEEQKVRPDDRTATQPNGDDSIHTRSCLGGLMSEGSWVLWKQ